MGLFSGVPNEKSGPSHRLCYVLEQSMHPIGVRCTWHCQTVAWGKSEGLNGTEGSFKAVLSIVPALHIVPFL